MLQATHDNIRLSDSHCTFSFSVLTLLIGQQEGHPACRRNWMVVRIWLELRTSWVLVCLRLIAPVVTTISIILSSNKIQNGNILIPANPGPPGKWSLNWRGSDNHCRVLLLRCTAVTVLCVCVVLQQCTAVTVLCVCVVLQRCTAVTVSCVCVVLQRKVEVTWSCVSRFPVVPAALNSCLTFAVKLRARATANFQTCTGGIVPRHRRLLP